ncbi:MAG: ASKHA domain-containing protein [Planctomycetota bacterium]|nr:ASKHA domain-containing protein [Planctomycetota bacterium]
MPVIIFAPSGKTVTIPPGTRLLDACRAAGFRLPAPCGGKGICGKCRVRVAGDTVPVDERQRRCLPESALAAGWRAACVATVAGDLEIADPETPAPGVILTDFGGRQPGRLGGDPGSLGLAAAEPGAGTRLGLAVDLGTTTMAAALCDLDSGATLAVVSRSNPQSLHGDDVVSRMEYACGGARELEEMRLLAMDAIRGLADDAMRTAGAGGDILLLAVGANTVMNHLLLGVSPDSLAVSPFMPRFRRVEPVPAGTLGWKGRAPLMLIVPNIAAYVGGDVTAGIAAHEAADLPGVTLFLDIGTNGEIVLAANGRVHACAAAAGPAFEGARISQGMRAAPGAICLVDADRERLRVESVGGVFPARGVCGTGLLDAVAALVRLGIVDEGGRMLEPDEAEELPLSPEILSRLRESENGMAFWLADPDSHGCGGVAITQRDVREFQLAKGAVAAGVAVLLDVAGVGAGQVDRVFLAGGFGNYLRPESAVAVSLLPREIPVDRIVSVGNASLAGTRLYLLSEEERRRADEVCDRVEYVELSGREDFQQAFVEQMLF